NLLKGKWGVYDLDDVVAGARYLIEDGVVDPSMIFIDGESAGGFTTISAITFTKFFTAGASFFGVSDLESLMKSTHKFESHYLQGLVGADQGPVYRERSGYHHAHNITTPIIFFQGTEDKVAM
ncbi:Peptidase S9 prolyl oligopeptidase catalytic domain, partial [Trinorchestia longiramus]